MTARIRLTLAWLLVVLAAFVVIAVEFVLVTGDQRWVVDFGYYHIAAERWAEGGPLYLAEQLDGPFHAICVDCYLYPPPFAQLLVPVSVIPIDIAKAIWFPLMLGAGWLSVWLALGVGGARRTLESAAWSFVAVTFFLPVFHAAWGGNVGTILGLLAVLVALGGTVAGVAAALAALLKVSPAPLVLVALAAGRTSAVAALVSLGAVVALSFVLSPSEWLEYPAVLLNMTSGGSDWFANLAPAEVASRLGWDGNAQTILRFASIAGGIVATIGAVWAARRAGGLPLAVFLATVAMLVVPGTLWYHYLAVIAPLVAMAWPRTTRAGRLAVVLAGTVVTLANSPLLPYWLALFGAAVMLAVAGQALWLATSGTARARRFALPASR